MLRHPDSERHVSSYTTLVSSHRTTENSCSECVSGPLAAFHLYGRPLVVSRLFAARDDVAEILRRAGALIEIRIVIEEGSAEYICCLFEWVAGVANIILPWNLVALGVCGISTQVSDVGELLGVCAVFAIRSESLNGVAFGSGGLVDVPLGDLVLVGALGSGSG